MTPSEEYPVVAVHKTHKVLSVQRVYPIISCFMPDWKRYWARYDWSAVEATDLEGRILFCLKRPCDRDHCSQCRGDDVVIPPKPALAVVEDPEVFPIISVGKVQYKIHKRMTEDVLPSLGFTKTGRILDPFAVSDDNFSKAIRGYICTSDQCTQTGVALPGLPSRERSIHEGVLAQRGWFRTGPAWETILVKYPPPPEPEAPVKVKNTTPGHWSDSPSPVLYEIKSIRKRKVLRVETEE